MNFRRGKREVPELNTTSTADISFILLVFFKNKQLRRSSPCTFG